MKKLLLPAIAVMMWALTSCQPPSASDALGEQNKELVKKFMDAVIAGKTTSMEEMMADNFMAFGPSRKDSLNKRQYLDNWKENWDRQLSAIRYVEAVVLPTTVTPEINSRAAGDWILKWGTVSVDYKNGNAPVKFNIHIASRITNGKIDRIYDYYNEADILAQQGYTFVPPAREEGKK